ncbi:MAG TPA: PfaD family polyunsaturated fatty acid/polyketide biosynthesis protein [Chloroflexota bacterium]|nr:PfaD family polyunsaturated fatty acid/polyketide biosynthesis protein [Chloroflexota bacterium]
MSAPVPSGRWYGQSADVAFDVAGMQAKLLDLDRPCYVVRREGRIGLASSGEALPESSADGQADLLALVKPLPPRLLGDSSFQDCYRVQLSYATGSMANGIASESLVTALARQRLLSSFGAAGLLPGRIFAAIQQLQAGLPDGSYSFNLIHSPSEDALERQTVELYLEHGVRTVEASAYLDLTPHVVRFRVAGLRKAPNGVIERDHRLIAKVSRREVASKFLGPAPPAILAELLAHDQITSEQAAMAGRTPLCDDLTVEADSGGHTDNRPLVCLLPSLIELRDEIQAEHNFDLPVRVGAAGGVSTPASALAAFVMGAAYVVTGSVNQSCLEAGASAHTKTLLAQAGMADVMMAPAADMFEMGVKVQLLKRGTLFPMRAQRLYELYMTFDSLEVLPAGERERLERQLFHRGLDEVWTDVQAYFRERDPDQLHLAEGNPKRKMALVFRWYLGLSSRWSNTGEPEREIDYQIWCGPSMGAFNDWVRGSYLEAPEARSVVDVAWHIMRGAAYLYRLQELRLQGITLPSAVARYVPQPL